MSTILSIKANSIKQEFGNICQDIREGNTFSPERRAFEENTLEHIDTLLKRIEELQDIKLGCSVCDETATIYLCESCNK